jgi:hypothetical protein
MQVPFDPRPQFDGMTVSVVNAMRGRAPFDDFTHIGGNRYVANEPPPSRPLGIPPPLATPDQSPTLSSPGARAIWPSLP